MAKTWQELQQMAAKYKDEDIALASMILQVAVSRKIDEHVFDGMPVIQTLIQSKAQEVIDDIVSMNNKPEENPEESDEYKNWMKNG